MIRWKVEAKAMSSTAKKEVKPAVARGGDWIHLRRIQVHCVLGVHPAERIRNRPVWLDISLECDTRPAAKTDRIEDALNYEGLEAELVALVKKTRFHLVESLAEHIAAACLGHEGVEAARIVVEKPGALPLTQSVAVEIVRRK